MDRRGICSAADQAIQCIDFAYQMPLAQTTDGRIAAHRPDGIKIEIHQPDPRTHARGDRSCLDPGMPAADNKDVKILHDPRIVQRIPRVKGSCGQTPCQMPSLASSDYVSRETSDPDGSEHHFPMQKRPNKASSISSVELRPIN